MRYTCRHVASVSWCSSPSSAHAVYLIANQGHWPMIRDKEVKRVLQPANNAGEGEVSVVRDSNLNFLKGRQYEYANVTYMGIYIHALADALVYTQGAVCLVHNLIARTICYCGFMTLKRECTALMRNVDYTFWFAITDYCIPYQFGLVCVFKWSITHCWRFLLSRDCIWVFSQWTQYSVQSSSDIYDIG